MNAIGSTLLTIIGTFGIAASIIGFSVWIASLIAREALKKGKSWQAFFWLSLIAPLITFIVIATISPEGSQTPPDSKKCPKCAEYVKSEAKVCKHCGSAI